MVVGETAVGVLVVDAVVVVIGALVAELLLVAVDVIWP